MDRLGPPKVLRTVNVYRPIVISIKIRDLVQIRSLTLTTTTALPHTSTSSMSTALDHLKASGTTVVSDSGDFECEPPTLQGWQVLM